jgi:bacillithiol biosynthesis deacetylase BshB1
MASILIVGPHPDDQELGMGGTIARLAAQGHAVCLLDMTNGEPTPYGDPATRAAEAADAACLLSAPNNPVTRRLLDLPNRTVEHTIEARRKVAGAIRAVQASILFVPFPEDAHPDHRAVTRIVEDARFDAKLTGLAMPGDEGRPPTYPKWLFYYYATHLRWVADPSFLVDITGFEEQKRRAVVAYRSQFVVNEKNRAVVDWVAAAGAYFGSRIGVPAAEPFFTKEPIGLTSLDALA